jgi:hypothetical protein
MPSRPAARPTTPPPAHLSFLEGLSSEQRRCLMRMLEASVPADAGTASALWQCAKRDLAVAKAAARKGPCATGAPPQMKAAKTPGSWTTRQHALPRVALRSEEPIYVRSSLCA